MKVPNVEVVRCDGCEREFVVEEGEPPDGFHGTAFLMSGGPSESVKWFACSERHIKRAVLIRINNPEEDEG